MTTLSAKPGRTSPRLLQVRRVLHLTPAMKRITLTGEALRGFPEDSSGSHIKLMFAREGQRAPLLPTLGPDGPVWPPAELRPITRTYTVSHYRAGNGEADESGEGGVFGELDIDFVLHGENGPASRWALNATPGSLVGVAGPGGPALYQPGADWYLLVGDASSLALLNAVLQKLPASAKGHVFIEVGNASDVLPLPAGNSIRTEWFVRGDTAPGQSSLLSTAVQQLPWSPGIPSVTLAGESTQVVTIRNFLLSERSVPRQMMYAVPYWKDTQTEENYHLERHRIMDELDAPSPLPASFAP